MTDQNYDDPLGLEANMVKRSLYMTVLDSLDSHSNEIQTSFTNRANVNGNLEVEQINELIKDLNVTLSCDLDETRDFLATEVERINNSSKDPNNGISFEVFMQLLKNWLEGKTGKKVTDLVEKEPNLSLQKTLSIGNRANTARKLVNKSPKNNHHELEIIPDPSLPENYQRNKEKLSELMKKHETTFRETFQLRQDPDLHKIALVDHFIFLQDCFYQDHILLMETKSDEDDFFSSVNSYRRLGVIAENFFRNFQGINEQDYDPKQIFLTFEECFEILDYWFKTDDQVILINESEKSKVVVHQNIDQTKSEVISEIGIPQDVKSLILDTISKYKAMMTNSDKDVEKIVLQTTIETLYKKISMLETGIPDENVVPVEDETMKKKNTRILKALKDIFEFYSKQHLHGLKSSTFEEMERQYNSINLSKFSVILKRFFLKVDHHKIKEKFRKISSNAEDLLNFEEFCILLQTIAVDSELVKRPRIIQKNPEVMKNYKPDSYKQSSLLLKENELLTSQSKQEHKKTPEEKVQDLWEHMGLHDGSYKKNLVPIQAPNNPEALKNRPNIFKHKFQPKVINQKLVLDANEELSLSPKNKFSKAAKLIRETPPKLELKIRDRSSDDHQNNNNSILKTHRAKLHLPSFARRFQRKLYSENDDQIQTDRADLRISTENDIEPYLLPKIKKSNISESYTPETKNKRNNYQKQFSQPGGIKPLNFNQLGIRGSHESSSSPKMRKLKEMQQNEKAQTERKMKDEEKQGMYIQILERANEIDQDSKQKESEIMRNLINLQNTKLKQGLMVARR